MTQQSKSFLGAARHAVAITPHLTTIFQETRAITCTGDGTAAIRFADSAADVTVSLVAGTVYPYAITSCRITGTTATGIVGLY
ncbi:hypothetical protein J1C56_02025 [Aminobacter anthyllidis]|uniref:Uncharacterized protein n=1 Tax=Aminobacter anthyllidis TaxID=1035067 RepID=A0A9X1A6X0_9HYPH|nr:hypothetical protein [Aminobacter anthyllidis]MBT1154362.1 hypothetical protein [Aminobacter anthyllidis]